MAVGGGKLRDLSQWVQLYTGAQINFGDLTQYLTYDRNVSRFKAENHLYLHINDTSRPITVQECVGKIVLCFTSLPALTAAIASASPTSAAAAAQVQRAEFRRVVNVVGVERLGWLYTNLKLLSG
jgi:hypothetical protein